MLCLQMGGIRLLQAVDLCYERYNRETRRSLVPNHRRCRRRPGTLRPCGSRLTHLSLPVLTSERQLSSSYLPPISAKYALVTVSRCLAISVLEIDCLIQTSRVYR